VYMLGNVGRVTGVFTNSETYCKGVTVTEGVSEGEGVFVGVAAIGDH
jgi:hypothetical protein